MRQAPGRRSPGAAGTGISLGASAFRLLLDLGAARRGRSASARGLARLVLLAMRRPQRPTATGLEIERFPACLRIGLKIGLRIGLGLFCLGLGVAAFVFSLHFASSTLRYLVIRRVCDGQELEEVWMPTLIPGTTVPHPDAHQDASASDDGE